MMTKQREAEVHLIKRFFLPSCACVFFYTPFTIGGEFFFVNTFRHHCEGSAMCTKKKKSGIMHILIFFPPLDFLTAS